MSFITQRLLKVTIFVFVGMLAGPLYAATPLGMAKVLSSEQPWGISRPITEADRALIASYRSGSKRPSIETNFTNPSEIQSLWSVQSDDTSNTKSCRRPGNVVVTGNGLQLRTLAALDCHAEWSTGSIWSKARYRYGFFEATMKIGDISGLNNAFWLTTDDHFEIDIAEVHYPSTINFTLHDWVNGKSTSVGFYEKFADNFSQAYHDYGVLWGPTAIVFEVDGEPVAAIETNGSIIGTADIRFSTALLDWAGKIPDNPSGHNMYVNSLRVYPL